MGPADYETEAAQTPELADLNLPETVLGRLASLEWQPGEDSGGEDRIGPQQQLIAELIHSAQQNEALNPPQSQEELDRRVKRQVLGDCLERAQKFKEAGDSQQAGDYLVSGLLVEHAYSDWGDDYWGNSTEGAAFVAGAVSVGLAGDLLAAATASQELVMYKSGSPARPDRRRWPDPPDRRLRRGAKNRRPADMVDFYDNRRMLELAVGAEIDEKSLEIGPGLGPEDVEDRVRWLNYDQALAVGLSPQVGQRDPDLQARVIKRAVGRLGSHSNRGLVGPDGLVPFATSLAEMATARPDLFAGPLEPELAEARESIKDRKSLECDSLIAGTWVAGRPDLAAKLLTVSAGREEEIKLGLQQAAEAGISLGPARVEQVAGEISQHIDQRRANLNAGLGRWQAEFLACYQPGMEAKEADEALLPRAADRVLSAPVVYGVSDPEHYVGVMTESLSDLAVSQDPGLVERGANALRGSIDFWGDARQALELASMLGGDRLSGWLADEEIGPKLEGIISRLEADDCQHLGESDLIARHIEQLAAASDEIMSLAGQLKDCDIRDGNAWKCIFDNPEGDYRQTATNLAGAVGQLSRAGLEGDYEVRGLVFAAPAGDYEQTATNLAGAFDHLRQSGLEDDYRIRKLVFAASDDNYEQTATSLAGAFGQLKEAGLEDNYQIRDLILDVSDGNYEQTATNVIDATGHLTEAGLEDNYDARNLVFGAQDGNYVEAAVNLAGAFDHLRQSGLEDDYKARRLVLGAPDGNYEQTAIDLAGAFDQLQEVGLEGDYRAWDLVFDSPEGDYTNAAKEMLAPLEPLRSIGLGGDRFTQARDLVLKNTEDDRHDLATSLAEAFDQLKGAGFESDDQAWGLVLDAPWGSRQQTAASLVEALGQLQAAGLEGNSRVRDLVFSDYHGDYPSVAQGLVEKGIAEAQSQLKQAGLEADERIWGTILGDPYSDYDQTAKKLIEGNFVGALDQLKEAGLEADPQAQRSVLGVSGGNYEQAAAGLRGAFGQLREVGLEADPRARGLVFGSPDGTYESTVDDILAAFDQLGQVGLGDNQGVWSLVTAGGSCREKAERLVEGYLPAALNQLEGAGLEADLLIQNLDVGPGPVDYREIATDLMDADRQLQSFGLVQTNRAYSWIMRAAALSLVKMDELTVTGTIDILSQPRVRAALTSNFLDLTPELRDRLAELDPQAVVDLYCQGGDLFGEDSARLLSCMERDSRSSLAPAYFRYASRRLARDEGKPSFDITLSMVANSYNQIDRILDQGEEAKAMLERIQATTAGGHRASLDGINLATSIIEVGLEPAGIETVADARTAMVEGLNRELGLDLDVSQDGYDQLVEKMGDLLPSLIYARTASQPTQTRLAGIIEALAGGNYHDHKYPPRDQLVEAGILPPIDEVAYQRWQASETSFGDGVVVNTTADVSDKIRQVVAPALLDHPVLGEFANLPEPAAKLEAIGSALSQIGQQIGAIHRQKQSGEIDSAQAEAGVADLQQQKQQLELARDAVYLAGVTDEEVVANKLQNEAGRPTQATVDQTIERLAAAATPGQSADSFDQLQGAVSRYRTVAEAVGRIEVSDVDEFQTTIEIGANPVGSCQHYQTGSHKQGLLGYFDANAKIIMVRNPGGGQIARAILRLASNQNGDPAMVLERTYSSQASGDIEAAVKAHAKAKANALGLNLYITGMDSPTETITLAKIAGPYAYSDAFGGLIASQYGEPRAASLVPA